MSNEIVVSNIGETRALAKELSNAQLLPQALKKKPEDILAVVLTGAELGLGPMQSIRGIQIIEGKIGMASSLIAALILKSPVCEKFQPIKISDECVTYLCKRKGQEPVEVSYTAADAKKAGLSSKSNHQKYPTDMLAARCISRAGRLVFADVCMGIYETDTGEVHEVEKEASPQKEHVEAVKDELREQLKPKAQEIEDAVIVEEPKVIAAVEQKAGIVAGVFAERIKACTKPDELKAMGAELKALSKEEKIALKPIWDSKTAELQGGKQ